MSTNITASAKDWIKALTFVSPAISHRPLAPCLGCVRIDPTKGTLSGFDYQISALTGLPEFDVQGEQFLTHFGTLIGSIKMITRLDKSAPVTLTSSTGEEDSSSPSKPLATS